MNINQDGENKEFIQNESTKITNENNEKSLKQKTWFIVLMLFIFFPVGAYLMWKYKKFKLPVRIVSSIVLGFPFLVFSMFVIFLCMPCSHEWKEATCITPKTCMKCGVEEGESAGHIWEEANCSAPMTCSICGETDGDALEHSVDEWNVVVEPTYSKEGKKEGRCIYCDKVMKKSIAKLEKEIEYPECEECYKDGEYTLEGISGETEYYCYEHYEEIQDMLSNMIDNAPKCEVCSELGTESLIGISGATEYYCTYHYNEMVDALADMLENAN